jgi:GT2 family glycosyltransferase
MKIIFCIPGNTFCSEFVKSWTALVAECIKRDIEITFVNRYSSMVHFARAMCLGADVMRGEKQAPFGGKREYDYIMWIDSDIVFKPSDFFRLLETPHEITCGNYMMSDRTHTTTVKEWDETYFINSGGAFEFMTPAHIKREKERYIKVAYSGMGWMLIKNGVFERISYPWFHHDVICIGHMVDMCSEDVAFCRNAEKAGISIYVDKTIWVGHHKSFVI